MKSYFPILELQFPALQPEETRILLMRPGPHKDNILTPKAVAMCRATGRALATTGVEINRVCSSPAARAIETALETLHGYGKMVYFHTDVRLADTAINEAGQTAVKKVKAIMADRELSGEVEMAKILFDSDGEFSDLMTRRGDEGANYLRKINFEHPGKTILVPSHGITRIENTLMRLHGKGIHQPGKLVKTCQIINLVFNSTRGEVIKENWLELITTDLL